MRRAALGSDMRRVFVFPLASLVVTRASVKRRDRPLADATDAVAMGTVTVSVAPAETVHASSHVTVSRTAGPGGWVVEPASLTWGGVVSFGADWIGGDVVPVGVRSEVPEVVGPGPASGPVITIGLPARAPAPPLQYAVCPV